MMRTFYSVVKQKSYISKTGEKLPSVVLQAQFLRNVTLILSCFSLSAHKNDHGQFPLTVFSKNQSQKVEKLYIRKMRTCAVLLKPKSLRQHQFPLPVSVYARFPKCQTIPLKLKGGKVGWCGDRVESLLFLNVSVYKDETMPLILHCFIPFHLVAAVTAPYQEFVDAAATFLII